MVSKLHFIFDLDGTLFDSHNQIVSAVKIVRGKYRLPPLAFNKIVSNIGLHASSHFNDVTTNGDMLDELVYNFREQLKIEVLKKNPIFPGVLSFLQEAKLNAIRLSVATTKPTPLARWTINNSELDRMFDHIQGTDSFEPKPNPEVISRCTTDFPDHKAIMFGDRTEDILAARNSNIIGIGVKSKFVDVNLLTKAGASRIIASWLDITDYKKYFEDLESITL